GLGCDGRILRVGQSLAELLVTAMEVADHGVDADHGLAGERQDRAEHTVGGRMLRPHVHREALAASVSQLDDFSRFRIHGTRRGAMPPLRTPPQFPEGDYAPLPNLPENSIAPAKPALEPRTGLGGGLRPPSEPPP